MIEKPEEIKILTIDDTPYEVAKMSENVQTLVATYNKWNGDSVELQNAAEEALAEYRDRIGVQEAAKSELSRRIIATIQQENEERKKEETAEKEEAVVTETMEVTDDFTSDGSDGE